ncbi:hypothetical protein JCM14469_36610 [Desulfatiferula olefinivorans]
MLPALLSLFFSLPARAALLTVTNGSDAGPGSLRQTVIDASDGDTIAFTLGSDPIVLNSGPVEITRALTLEGIDQATGDSVIVDAGGGSRVFIIAPGIGKTVTVNDLVITGGYTQDQGGGIYFTGPIATLNLNRCSIRGNRSESGGGLYINGGTVTIRNTTLSGNTASFYGGGIYVFGETATLVNTTISGNTAELSGGIGTTNATVFLINTTISANDISGESGGGIYVFSNTVFYLLNTLIVNNSASGRGKDIFIDTGCMVHAYYSWYGSLEGAGVLHGTSLAPTRSTAYTDGDLGPLSDHGGPTRTMAVISGSPADGNGAFAYYNPADGFYLEATDTTFHRLADWTAPTADDADKITTDQRGRTRTPPVTIGAFAGTVPRDGTDDGGDSDDGCFIGCLNTQRPGAFQ